MMERIIPDSIEFRTEIKEGIQLLYAQGQLIYQTIPSAKEQLSAHLVNVKGYVLDMNQITRVDSTGFGFILNFIKRIPKETRLIVVITDPFIKELFYITKLDQLITILPTVSEAIAHFCISGDE